MTLIATEWLSAMGKTQADVNALPNGIKDCASWLVTSRATIRDRFSDTVTSGYIGSAQFARDYTHVAPEIHGKWIYTQPNQGTPPDFSDFDALISQARAFSPGMGLMYHLVLGTDIYLPSWLISDLTTTPSNLSSRISDYIAAMAAHFNDDPFYRIDGCNELCNAGTGSTRASIDNTTRGWTTSACRLRTAQLANGGDPCQFIWDAFTQLHAAFPSAKLAWTQFNQEVPSAPFSVPVTGQGACFANLADFAQYNQPSMRQRYEIYRMKQNGIPIHVAGHQFRVNAMMPPDFNAFAYTLWDYNRFGVLPAVTECSVTVSPKTTGYLPQHILTKDDATIQRYTAWVYYWWLKTMLAESDCEEVSFWSDAAGCQTATVGNKDYPLRTAVMLAIAQAAAPGSRTLKRGTVIEGHYTIPIWVNVNGSPTLNTNAATMSITGGTGNLQMPWAWCNSAWMPKPISADHYILAGTFQITSAPASGTVLIGVGNAISGTPTNSVKIVLNGNVVHLDIVVGGSNVLSQDIGTIPLNQLVGVAVRVNGTAITVALNGANVASYTAGGSFNDQSSVYILSNPDNSGVSSALSYHRLKVLHGPDYPNGSEDIRNLSTREQRNCNLNYYSGRP